MKKPILTVLFIALFLILKTSFSQTIIPGGVVSGTWTIEESPYIVEGSIMISDGQSLNIEPGVEVEFQGYYKLIVSGSLHAVGTITDSISFTVSDTTNGWRGIRFDNTSSSNDSSKIEFCKISYGKVIGLTSPDNVGGAIFVDYFSKLSINHNLFHHNSALSGGAIFCYFSNPEILFNTFKFNTAKTTQGNMCNGGGAISLVYSDSKVSNNLFENNTTFTGVCGGGAIQCSQGTPIISNNVIIYNSVQNGSGGGGGILCSSSARIYNNIISNNIVNGYSWQDGGGGGIYCYFDGSPIISNNLITNNSALKSEEGGGGIYLDLYMSPKLINNTIANNSTLGNGGAIFCRDQASPIFYNCILYGNNAAIEGTQVFLNDEQNDPDFLYCNIEGGVTAFGVNGNFYTGNYQNNIETDPLFVSPSGGSGSGYNGVNSNWSISAQSSCINQGTPDTTGLFLPPIDFAGNPRINNDTIDIGAYEYYCFPIQINQEPINSIKCEGESISFIISVSANEYNTQWLKDSNNIPGATDTILTINYIHPSDSGFYQCCVTNPCDTVIIDIANLQVMPLPLQPSNISGINILCQDSPNSDYSTDGAAYANNYYWEIQPSDAGTISGIGTTGTVNWSEFFSGTAHITVRGLNDCGIGTPSQEFEVIVDPSPVVVIAATPNDTVCVSEHVILDAGNPGSTYQWSTGATSQEIEIEYESGPGGGLQLYWVIVTDNNGCQKTDEISIYFDPCTGLPEYNTNIKIEVFPNPVDNNFSLKIIGIKRNIIITIYNTFGEEILTEPVNNITEEYSIDIDFSGYQNGIYFLKVQDLNGEFQKTTKFLKY